MQPPFRAASRARTGSAFRRPPQTPAPTRGPSLRVQAGPVPRTVQASQYRDVDEGLAGDGGPDGGRVLIAHDGCVLTGPVRHEVVDVGVPPGHGAAIGAALGLLRGRGLGSGWRAGKTESLGHARCRPDRGSASYAAALTPHFLLLPPPRFLFAKGGGGGACSPLPLSLPSPAQIPNFANALKSLPYCKICRVRWKARGKKNRGGWGWS